MKNEKWHRVDELRAGAQGNGEGGGGQSQGSESKTKEGVPVSPSSGTCRKCGQKVCLGPDMKGHMWYLLFTPFLNGTPGDRAAW